MKDLHGDKYVKAFEQHQSSSRLRRLLKHVELNTESEVADFGCGSGMLMEQIAPEVKSYIGVDFSESFINVANKKKHQLNISNAEFVCSEIGAFCQKHPKSFDIGLAMDFSEHVYDKEWVEILRSIKGSLKTNGKLYLHTPNASFFLEIMKKKNFIVKQFPEHIAVRTPDHNTALIKEAGFSIGKLVFMPHYNILKTIHPLSKIPFVGKFFEARV